MERGTSHEKWRGHKNTQDRVEGRWASRQEPHHGSEWFWGPCRTKCKLYPLPLDLQSHTFLMRQTWWLLPGIGGSLSVGFSCRLNLVHAKLLKSHIRYATLWTLAHQAPLSVSFSRLEYWSELPLPPLGNLPDPGIEPTSLRSPVLAVGFLTTSATWQSCLGGSEGQGNLACCSPWGCKESDMT